MGWVRVTDLVRDIAGGSTESFSATLPAGRIILVIGANFDTAYSVLTSLSHPAVASAARIGTEAKAASGSNYDVCDIWDLQSTGGSGTFTMNFSSGKYFSGIVGYQITQNGPVLAQDTKQQSTPQSTMILTATASAADHGIAAGFVTNGTAGVNDTIGPWADLTDFLTLSNSYHRLIVAAKAGLVSGDTQTIAAASGNLAIATGRLLLFGSSASGGGSAMLSARVP